MNFESIAISFELAKILKKLGVNQETQLSWIMGFPPRLEARDTEGQYANVRVYAAFTSSELGELLKGYEYDMPWYCEGLWWWSTLDEDGTEETEQEARGAMLAHLIEHRYVEN